MATRNTTTRTAEQRRLAAERAARARVERQALVDVGLRRPTVSSTPGTRHVAGRPGSRPPKPKTMGQWLGGRIGRFMGKGPVRRGMRGFWRLLRREGEGIRERKRARKEYRNPTIPTHTQNIKNRLTERRGKPRAQCAGCGSALHPDAVATHTCGETKAEQSAAMSAATQNKQAVKAWKRHARTNRESQSGPPGAADSVKAHRLAVRDERRQMTKGQRAKEFAKRWTQRAIGTGGKCETCRRTLSADEFHDHDCMKSPASASGATTTATGATAPPVPANAPAPAPNPNQAATPSPAPGTNGRNAMTAPAGTSNGTGAGGGGGTAHAIAQAFSAWAHDIPQSHEEMRTKAYMTQQSLAAAARSVEELQAALIKMRIHPACVQPLAQTSTSLAEAGQGVVNMYMQIEAVYAAALAQARAGHLPDNKYLQNAG